MRSAACVVTVTRVWGAASTRLVNPSPPVTPPAVFSSSTSNPSPFGMRALAEPLW